MRRILRQAASLGVFAFVFSFFLFVGNTSAEEAMAEENQLKVPLGLDEDYLVIPKDNPMTQEKIELGRALYFDVRLSANDTIACATCHSPKLAFTDGQPVSMGIGTQKGGRSAPTVINRVFSKAQFWDGRVPSLEEQAKGPITNPIEMGMPSHAKVVQKLNDIEGYRKWFRKVFGTDVTLDGIAKAIAAFERTVLSGNSPVDRYNYLGDEKALSADAIRGMKLFKEKANCTQCHAGFNFTDEEFHNIGIGWDGSKPDLGLYAISKKTEDIGAFKTPTVREIANTGPYMHDGRFATLRQVIDFYDQGGLANPFLDSQIKKLNLTDQEKVDIIEFLRSLSGEGWQHITPPDSFPQ